MASRQATCNVYFIRDSSSGAIKIGRTDGPVKARMASIQTGMIGTLSLLGVIRRVPPETEKQLHWRFRASRIRGEWFRASPDLMAYIAAHGGPDTPCLAPEPRKSRRQMTTEERWEAKSPESKAIFEGLVRTIFGLDCSAPVSDDLLIYAYGMLHPPRRGRDKAPA
jgi:hypothetical protein